MLPVRSWAPTPVPIPVPLTHRHLPHPRGKWRPPAPSPSNALPARQAQKGPKLPFPGKMQLPPTLPPGSLQRPGVVGSGWLWKPALAKDSGTEGIFCPAPWHGPSAHTQHRCLPLTAFWGAKCPQHAESPLTPWPRNDTKPGMKSNRFNRVDIRSTNYLIYKKQHENFAFYTQAYQVLRIGIVQN